jgi:O-antigen ligase
MSLYWIMSIVNALLGILQSTVSMKFAPSYILGTIHERILKTEYVIEYGKILRPVGFAKMSFSFPKDLIPGFIISLGLFLQSGKIKLKYLLPLLLFTIALFISQSRSAMLGIIIGSLYLIYSVRKMEIHKYLRHRKMMYIIFAIISIGIISAIFLGYAGIFKHIISRYTTIGISAISRVGYAIAALEMFFDHPILGIGLGQFKATLPNYLNKFISPSLITEGILTPHNVYLGLMAESGLIALFLYLYIMLIGVKSSNPDYFQGPTRWRALIIRASLISLIVEYIFHNHFFDNQLWFIMGLSLAHYKLFRKVNIK